MESQERTFKRVKDIKSKKYQNKHKNKVTDEQIESLKDFLSRKCCESKLKESRK